MVADAEFRAYTASCGVAMAIHLECCRVCMHVTALQRELCEGVVPRPGVCYKVEVLVWVHQGIEGGRARIFLHAGHAKGRCRAAAAEELFTSLHTRCGVCSACVWRASEPCGHAVPVRCSMQLMSNSHMKDNGAPMQALLGAVNLAHPTGQVKPYRRTSACTLLLSSSEWIFGTAAGPPGRCVSSPWYRAAGQQLGLFDAPTQWSRR